MASTESDLNEPSSPVSAATTQGPLFTKVLSSEPIQNGTDLPPKAIDPTSNPVPKSGSRLPPEPPDPPLPLPSQAVGTHDRGYVPRGFHRELVGRVWKTVRDKHKAPEDVYGDIETFPEPSATVQIVTFFMEQYTGQDIQARWESPLTSPDEVKSALEKDQEPHTWRWVNCEGLHGPIMKAIAEGTGASSPAKV